MSRSLFWENTQIQETGTSAVYWDDGVSSVKDLSTVYYQPGSGAKYKVWTKTLVLYVPNGVNNFDVAQYISDNNAFDAVNIKLIIADTSVVGRLNFYQKDLAHFNSQTAIELFNYGEIQGAANSGTAINLERPVKITNEGWIRAGGGQGGKGGTGGPTNYIAGYQPPKYLVKGRCYAAVYHPAEYGPWHLHEYSSLFRYYYKDHTWPSENDHRIYIAGSIVWEYGEKKGCDRTCPALDRSGFYTYSNKQFTAQYICGGYAGFNGGDCRSHQALLSRFYTAAYTTPAYCDSDYYAWPPYVAAVPVVGGGSGGTGASGRGFNAGIGTAGGGHSGSWNTNSTQKSGAGGSGGTGGDWGEYGGRGNTGLKSTVNNAGYAGAFGNAGGSAVLNWSTHAHVDSTIGDHNGHY